MKKIIAVIGDAGVEKGSDKYQTAYEMGKALVNAGYRVQSGGLSGVMEAAFAGAHAAEKYSEGDTVAILPSFDRNAANCYADVVIPTGLDVMRNALVVNADAVIAIGGGAGTLSEMAIAWAFQRLVISFKNVEGWSKELADRKIDGRMRYVEVPEDKVYGVESAQQAIALLQKYLPIYCKQHQGIGVKTAK